MYELALVSPRRDINIRESLIYTLIYLTYLSHIIQYTVYTITYHVDIMISTVEYCNMLTLTSQYPYGTVL